MLKKLINFFDIRWVVETIWNTDENGRWVDVDTMDHPPRTLHGYFWKLKEATEFLQGFCEDDKEVYDMRLVRRRDRPADWPLNPVVGYDYAMDQ